MGFIHLHLHTEYSFLDGMTKLEELFKKLSEIGQNAVAITEHGNMHAMVTKYNLAKKYGIKLIFGTELYLCKDIQTKEKDRYHLILLAENETGFKNLLKLLSIANKEGFYYKPRIDKKLLKQYSEGIIATSACLQGEISQSMLYNDYEKTKSITQEYIDIFGTNNFFLEVQEHYMPEQKIINETTKKLSKDLNLKVISANDAHYLNKEDAKAHDILLCIQTKKKLMDKDRMRFPGEEFYVKTEKEMRDLFKENPEYADNTVEIANRCNYDLDIGNTYFPNYYLTDGKDFEDELKKRCLEGFQEKYKGTKLEQDALKRMDYELSVINKMGFCAYFLIVADYIREAKKFCQVGPGRGSGAGSIVAYLTGITQLEPLSLGLLFERFLNPERISLPDFDVDFGDRDKVLEYVMNKYGKEKVALIGTYGTMMAKAVIKDVARTMGIPFEVSNDITKYVTEKTIQKSFDLKDEQDNPINKKLIYYEEKYPELFEIARKLEGTARQPGIHACGVVWGPKPINDYTATFFKEGHLVTQMDKDEVETLGLVKFDFLGLKTLNIIQNILEQINKDTKWLEKIPLDDKNVFKMLSKGDSVGVFQLESPGMQKTLKLVKPVCFDDLIAIVSLYRPGSMDYIDVYARRKDGVEKVIYPDALAEEILKPTYGILVYQEQVMQLSQVLAGFTMGQADTLRKAIGKKKLDLMKKMEDDFKEGCKNVAKMNEKVINDLWDNIVKFASYSFNKSHAAAYAMIAYRTAYLKAHYKLEYFTANISAVTDEPDKMVTYIKQAEAEDILLRPPSINKSGNFFTSEKTLEGKEIIRIGLKGIKNLGDKAIEEIFKHRPYSNYNDFINKVDLSVVNKRVLKHLIMSGAFDELGNNRNELLSSYENIEKEKETSTKQLDLSGIVIKKNVIEKKEEFPIETILEFEKETIGLPISGHLLDKYPSSKSSKYVTIKSIKEDREFSIFGIIKRYNQIVTKKGDPMAFVEVEDRSSQGTIIVFPRLFSEIDTSNFIEGYPIIVSGNMRRDSLIASSIEFPKK
ncbi:MAG: DNA polymerase III subunit alpha [Candidatus Nanoarchaeia archaeon]|nr:DNA polymerase III subunit alpha [Candidatus Nanoarchaeia archaeon]